MARRTNYGLEKRKKELKKKEKAEKKRLRREGDPEAGLAEGQPGEDGAPAGEDGPADDAGDGAASDEAPPTA